MKEDEDYLDEDVFWLYYSVVQDDSLLIGGYEGDATDLLRGKIGI